MQKKLPNFWERGQKIERTEEEIVLHLSQEELDKCRFEVIDQNYRLVECVTHRGKCSHGLRLFPVHLWKLVDGMVYHKDGKRWKRWRAIAKNNIKRTHNIKN